tara:strand:+ start:372 stop:632 length:261 start_codon:yes stop_codon:yes gene_type:complete
MKIYLLTKENSSFLETFKTFEGVLIRAKEINKTHFNGEHFNFFGANGDEPYTIDSICLTKQVNYKDTYTLFFIRCIDSITGELCEL